MLNIENARRCDPILSKGQLIVNLHDGGEYRFHYNEIVIIQLSYDILMILHYILIT